MDGIWVAWIDRRTYCARRGRGRPDTTAAVFEATRDLVRAMAVEAGGPPTAVTYQVADAAAYGAARAAVRLTYEARVAIALERAASRTTAYGAVRAAAWLIGVRAGNFEAGVAGAAERAANRAAGAVARAATEAVRSAESEAARAARAVARAAVYVARGAAARAEVELAAAAQDAATATADRTRLDATATAGAAAEVARLVASVAAPLAAQALRLLPRTTGAAAAGAPASEPRTSLAVLRCGACLLPAAVRSRWVEEWRGELATLQTRRGRARFARQALRGMPRMAVTLRVGDAVGEMGDGASTAGRPAEHPERLWRPTVATRRPDVGRRRPAPAGGGPEGGQTPPAGAAAAPDAESPAASRQPTG
jgi:hypothetical protein